MFHIHFCGCQCLLNFLFTDQCAPQYNNTHPHHSHNAAFSTDGKIINKVDDKAGENIDNHAAGIVQIIN